MPCLAWRHAHRLTAAGRTSYQPPDQAAVQKASVQPVQRFAQACVLPALAVRRLTGMLGLLQAGHAVGWGQAPSSLYKLHLYTIWSCKVLRILESALPQHNHSTELA